MEHVTIQFFTLSFIALALGMDAFSVGLGMGLLKIHLHQMIRIGIIIGGFHMLMPFLGILVGEFLSEQIGHVAAIVGGLLLLVLGIQMVGYGIFNKRENMIMPIGFGIILFALSVSLDSFSVGLSLGMSNRHSLLAIILFGVVATIMTWSGLLLGRKIQQWFGIYSKIIGGSILLLFGLKMIFG